MMRFGLKIVFLLIGLMLASASVAGVRFTSSYPCLTSGKTCVSSGEREIDGFKVTKDCWEWAYTKTCSYPSRNDCTSYRHCYFVSNGVCLLQDSIGNCVNRQLEFSCKSQEAPAEIERTKVRTGLKEKEGAANLLCSGIPCIDGNCVDKSYETNGEMFDSLSKLYSVSKMNPDKQGNFNLFQGSGQNCSKKAAEYSNCCRADPKGWGRSLGARCTKDENLLAEMRAKNLCVYAGKSKSRTLGATMLVKHHFCCFGNLLDKVIQVEGRKQLGLNFGSGASPNCRGLTMSEIQRLDFSRMDFSEFIEDFKGKFAGKYKAPSSKDMSRTIEGSVSGIKKYDGNPDNPANNATGWSGAFKDDDE